MSNQPEGSIPLRHAPDDKGYRLIELPPEVQSLLESKNAPVLTLESSDDSALLKTPDRTYALRQKNTSNSVIILSSRPSPEGSDYELAAISTIQETVELQLVHDPPVGGAPLKNTGSKGKWHEKFGKGR
ncbi:hypothetical protein PT974_12134 [Cladobotryum mycophilum]|uniref:Sister chromatid cohesion protein DCC1 n=1 Tax=Cladobotryum mycophilum TaxID=491253 RepID=A0ABR0S760_9HYPO